MANIYDMVDTWNDGATTFTAIKMNVTDTASASDSLLLDLQVGGTSKFSIGKLGNKINLTDSGYGAAAIQALGARIDFIPGAAGGAAKAAIDFAGRFCTLSTLQIGSIDQANARVVLARDADDVLALRRSTFAQTFNLYKTYTNDTNYERASFTQTTTGLVLDAQFDGTGQEPDNILELKSDGVSKFSVKKNGQVGVATNTSFSNLQAGGGIRFETGTVIGSAGAGQFALGDSTGATRVFASLGTTGYFQIDAGQFFGFGAIAGQTYNAGDVRLYRDAANTLAQRNSTNAQTFNIYNTYDSSTIYERGFMRWNSNVLEIGTEHLNGNPRAVQYYFDSGQYSYLQGSTTGYNVTFATRYGTEFTTNNNGVNFYRAVNVVISGSLNNPARIRATSKGTTPSNAGAGVVDMHIEAGYGYAANLPGSSIKIAAGYGGTPTAEGAGGAGGSLKVWIGEGGEQNTSGGKGADGTFEVLGVDNTGTFATAPVFSVDYSGNVLMGTNQAPAVKSDTTQAGANTASINNIVTVTQAEYDLLTPDADTVYFITA